MSEAAIARLEEKQEAMNAKLDRLVEIATKTNGRVTDLERHRIEVEARIQTWHKAAKYLSPVIALLVMMILGVIILFVSDPSKIVEALKAAQ